MTTLSEMYLPKRCIYRDKYKPTNQSNYWSYKIKLESNIQALDSPPCIH